jgi:hypothetical protein
MAFNPFDVSTKELVWDDPADWLNQYGVGPPGPVDVIDSDMTALTAAADKVLRVGGPNPYLVNIEFQSYHETELVRTLWFRQVAIDYRHNLPTVDKSFGRNPAAGLSIRASGWRESALRLHLRYI